MEPERWKQIDQLLEQALEAPPEKRSAFLDATCEGDADTARRAGKAAARARAEPAASSVPPRSKW